MAPPSVASSVVVVVACVGFLYDGGRGAAESREWQLPRATRREALCVTITVQ